YHHLAAGGVGVDDVQPPGTAPTSKFISLGASLTEMWRTRIAPDRLALLRSPLFEGVHWVNIFAWYDIAPRGMWLEPPRQDGRWLPVFTPSPAVQEQQRLVPRPDPNPYAEPAPDHPGPVAFFPASVGVTNEASVLTDHNLYFKNEEQVLARL